MISDKVKVVVRSVGERTTEACIRSIISQGFPREAVTVLTAYPFSEALRQSLCVGLDARKDWTLIIDADVILRSDAIARILRVADSRPTNVCEVHGLVLDKLFGEFRLAGNHMYRTSMIPVVLDCISHDGHIERPETYALHAAMSRGYPFEQVALVVGLHDYEQKYADIFRKTFLQSYKHLHRCNRFLKYWRDNAEADPDFRVALEGFAFGLRFRPEVLATAADAKVSEAFSSLMLAEKAMFVDLLDPALYATIMTDAAISGNTSGVSCFSLDAADLDPAKELRNLAASRAQKMEKLFRDHSWVRSALHLMGKSMCLAGAALMVRKAKRGTNSPNDKAVG